MVCDPFSPLIDINEVVYMKLDLDDVLFKPRLWLKRVLIDRRRHPISYQEIPDNVPAGTWVKVDKLPFE
ncbi:MAG: hypothetical protein ACYTEO_19865 [Planctomycetota bacterium]|jgi:hypothetical protein